MRGSADPPAFGQVWRYSGRSLWLLLAPDGTRDPRIGAWRAMFIDRSGTILGIIESMAGLPTADPLYRQHWERVI